MMKKLKHLLSFCLILLFIISTTGFAVSATTSFKVVTYTGTGSNQSISGIGFQPDLVWIKRMDAAQHHNWFDSVRGPMKRIKSNETSAEETNSTSLISFDIDGFTLGPDNTAPGANECNYSNAQFVAWCWKADQTGVTNSNQSEKYSLDSGLSIIKYTGDGASSRQITHSLGKKPKTILIKRLDKVRNWIVYHDDIPISHHLVLNTTAAESTASYWNSIEPTETNFTIDLSGAVNEAGGEFIAYVFCEVPGLSAMGSYVGNGTINGPFIECGFQPVFLMIKRTDGADNWCIYDIKRDSLNPLDNRLEANTSNAEISGVNIELNFLSTGFQPKGIGSTINSSGGTYIYMAFGGYGHEGNLTISGNVGIGKLNPTEALEVNGTIKAKEIIVTNDGWADYVFDKNYNLKNLNQVEDFIKINHHLPDIPSSSQLSQTGLPVSEILKLQMQKIEELTLYLIQQDKKITNLEKENKHLKKFYHDQINSKAN